MKESRRGPALYDKAPVSFEASGTSFSKGQGLYLLTKGVLSADTELSGDSDLSVSSIYPHSNISTLALPY